ncbi:MAG: hypothetical protein KME30_27550 [Iphinoe sp. HA4291-MV1]|jgi:hypothetical protein|nr:hypothetical protein [Iphinoe sp. HA4291-MV1]
MEPVTLVAVATAIATTLLTKAWEKTGANLGDAAWQACHKLIEQLRHKNKLPLLTKSGFEAPLLIGEGFGVRSL